MRSLYRVLLTTLALIFLLFPAPLQTQPGLNLTRSLVPPVVNLHLQVLGSAVVYGPVVLTARHVLTYARGPVYIYYEDRMVPTQTVCEGTDEIDFAVLLTSIPSNDLLARGIPAKGAIVRVAGYPKGQFAVRSVLVEGIARNIIVKTPDGKSMTLKRVIVAHDLTRIVSNGGISGGGMFDAEGRLVGIICCVGTLTGFVAAVPLEDGIFACSQKGP